MPGFLIDVSPAGAKPATPSIPSTARPVARSIVAEKCLPASTRSTINSPFASSTSTLASTIRSPTQCRPSFRGIDCEIAVGADRVLGDARVVCVEIGHELRPRSIADGRHVRRTIFRGDRKVFDLPPIVVARHEVAIPHPGRRRPPARRPCSVASPSARPPRPRPRLSSSHQHLAAPTAAANPRCTTRPDRSPCRGPIAASRAARSPACARS